MFSVKTESFCWSDILSKWAVTLFILILAAVVGVTAAFSHLILVAIPILCVGGVILVGSLRSFPFSLFVLWMAMLGTDLIRRLVFQYSGELPVLMLLGIDIALISSYLSLYIDKSSHDRGSMHTRVYQLGGGLGLAFVALILLLVIQLLNPFGSIIARIVGFREYLLAVPTILIGWQLYSRISIHQRQVMLNVLLTSLTIMVFVALVQFQTVLPIPGFLAPFSKPIDLETRSFSGIGGDVKLVSSIFVSSKRFGRFLVLVFPLAWMLAHEVGSYRKEASLVILCLVGAFVSGSREAFIGTIFVLIFMYASSDLLRLLPILLVAPVLVFLAGDQFVLLHRLAFLSDGLNRIGERIQYMALLSHFSDTSAYTELTFLIGGGLGSWGQSTRIGVVNRYIGLTDSEVLLGVGDAGLYKLVVDTGYIGLILFLIVTLGIILVGGRRVMHMKGVSRARARACLGAIVLWVVLFIKGHTVLSDLSLAVLLWCYVGILLWHVSTYSYSSGKPEQRMTDA